MDDVQRGVQWIYFMSMQSYLFIRILKMDIIDIMLKLIKVIIDVLKNVFLNIYLLDLIEFVC